MPTIWIDRWIIFVKEQQIIAANGLMTPIDPDTGGDKTFGDVRLSATGEEPRTHSGCNTAATGAMTYGIKTAFEHVPWADIYDGHEWTWEDALADMGLQVIEEELEAQTLTARVVETAACATTSLVNNVKSDANEFWTGVKGLPQEVWKRATKNMTEW